VAITLSSASFTWASGSATASGTTNAITTTALYAKTVYGQIVQVGIATTAASIQVQESPDGSTYFSPPTKVYTAGLAAATYYFQIPCDPTCASVQVVYTAQVGGTSSTLTMQLGEVTGV
jgi:hypothetical protein